MARWARGAGRTPAARSTSCRGKSSRNVAGADGAIKLLEAAVTAEADRALMASDRVWTIVRPTFLTDDPGRWPKPFCMATATTSHYATVNPYSGEGASHEPAFRR
jgi:hypothetical protein